MTIDQDVAGFRAREWLMVRSNGDGGDSMGRFLGEMVKNAPFMQYRELNFLIYCDVSTNYQELIGYACRS